MKKLFLIILFVSKTIFANDLPELGSHFDNILTKNDEKKITHQIMSQVYQSGSVITDAEVNDYLKTLGTNLSLAGTQDKLNFKLFIINDPSINAFAMLGNIIGVHTGLIFAANSESELASVLSHEIAHITQKHLLRLFDDQAKNSYKTYLGIAIALLAARSNPQISQAAIMASNAAVTQNILNFTRQNEREADQIGLEILSRSGYDPRGFIDFFQTIQRFNEFSTGPAPSFLKTHPITSERISDIQDRLKNYSFKQDSSKIEFFFVKAKLKAYLGNENNITEAFLREIKDKRSINENASYFGLVYSFIRKNKIIDARKYFNILKKYNIESPMLIQLEAILLAKEMKYQDAYELYLKGLSNFPSYRAFIYGVANLLIDSGKIDESIEFLNKKVDLFNNDFILFELLAKAYSLKNFKLHEHENLSSAYYFKYNINEAITQMEIATKSEDGIFFDQSRVEFKLQELKKEAEALYN